MIDIGTPPQQLPLMIDTSSSHTYINPPFTIPNSGKIPTVAWQNRFLYKSSISSTFSWLACMDAEYCNICLQNKQQCAWEFACEQMYVMAKDVIHIHDDNASIDYIYFGYNSNNEQLGQSHIFSLDLHDDHMMMGGILSLNRKPTSFIQQMYIQHPTNKHFAHFFHQHEGYMAFGEDVDALIQQLNIANEDIEWIAYHNNDGWLYQVNLTGVMLNDELIFEGNGYLTFDTGVTGIGMSSTWREMVLDALNVELIQTAYYPYCINTDDEDILDDIFNVLPVINIAMSSDVFYTISAEQYLVNVDNKSVHYPFCLDITFDEYEGVCLGSHAMENYLIIYDDDAQNIGIYDKNTNHLPFSQDEKDFDDVLTIENEKANEYIYALSLALVAILICLLFVSAVCVALLHRVASIPPYHPKCCGNTQNMLQKAEHIDDDNYSMSSSISPLQSYYDGNVKSIVYDQVIRPWNSDQDIAGI